LTGVKERLARDGPTARHKSLAADLLQIAAVVIPDQVVHRRLLQFVQDIAQLVIVGTAFRKWGARRFCGVCGVCRACGRFHRSYRDVED